MWNDALPRNGITNWRFFIPAKTQPAFTDSWQSYMKPAGCSWIYIFAIGVGGAGAGANWAIPSSGGGGGSGGVARLLIPASFLPDIIYVRPAFGSNDPFSTLASKNSYVAIAPSTSASNLILTIPGGSNGFNNTAGAGASAAGVSGSTWLNIGLFTSVAGQSGAAGVTTADTNGNNVTFGASGLPITGGASGGMGSGVGGSIIGAGLLPTVSGSAVNQAGVDGFNRFYNFAPGFKLFPLLFSGGSGGGGGTGDGLFPASNGGGNGAWGCGGGGGGCPNVSTSGGTRASFGGDALILIGAF